MKKEYIIVGDTDHFKGCLITLGGTSFEHASQKLSRILNSPTENDKRLIAGHTNIRIETIEDEDCWWKNGCD